MWVVAVCAEARGLCFCIQWYVVISMIISVFKCQAKGVRLKGELSKCSFTVFYYMCAFVGGDWQHSSCQSSWHYWANFTFWQCASRRVDIKICAVGPVVYLKSVYIACLLNCFGSLSTTAISAVCVRVYIELAALLLVVCINMASTCFMVMSF